MPKTGLAPSTVRAIRAKGPAGSPGVRPLVYLATDYVEGEAGRQAIEACLRDHLDPDTYARLSSATVHFKP